MTKSRGALFLSAALVLAVGMWALISQTRRRDLVAPSVRGDTQAPGGMAGMDMSTNVAVRLTAVQLRQFGVTFGTVERRALASETRTTGAVMFDERRIAQVAPKIGGVVERLYVNATGQTVRRGAPLLELYSPELLAAQQELLVAEQLGRDMGTVAIPGVPAASTSLVDAARRRLQLLDISDAQIDEVLRTKRMLRALTLHAPAGGVVVEKHVVQGQSIVAGASLYTIADLSDVWIEIQLRGEDFAAVRVGAMARAEVAGVTGRVWSGRVAFVYPVLDSASRTVRARIAVANADGALKPGMYATVRVTTAARWALSVANTAILRTGERNVVFVDGGNGGLKPHDVTLGASAGEYTEVLTGLSQGDRVVTSAQFLLDSESNLGEVMRGMVGQTSSGDNGGMKDMPGMKIPPAGRR